MDSAYCPEELRRRDRGIEREREGSGRSEEGWGDKERDMDRGREKDRKGGRERSREKGREALQISYFPPEDVAPPHSPLLKGSQSSCLAHDLGSGNLRTSGALLLPWKPLADRIESIKYE